MENNIDWSAMEAAFLKENGYERLTPDDENLFGWLRNKRNLIEKKMISPYQIIDDLITIKENDLKEEESDTFPKDNGLSFTKPSRRYHRLGFFEKEENKHRGDFDEVDES